MVPECSLPRPQEPGCDPGPHEFSALALKLFVYVYFSIYQLDTQNSFHSKFYFMPLHVSSTCIITPIDVMIPEAV